jgi:hypothetical protein
MKFASPFLIFSLGAPLVISTCALLLINYTLIQPINPLNHPLSTTRVLSASVTENESDIFSLPFGRLLTTDARSIIIKNYLTKYSSPLEPYSHQIVEISDKYSLDYRLLVAIAQQESNLCKKIPPESYNCWGFGIYGDKVTKFSNYLEGLEIVAKTLKKNYIDNGLDTPEEIMAKYTPPSLEKGGPWAKGVNQFMTDLE